MKKKKERSNQIVYEKDRKDENIEACGKDHERGTKATI